MHAGRLLYAQQLNYIPSPFLHTLVYNASRYSRLNYGFEWLQRLPLPVPQKGNCTRRPRRWPREGEMLVKTLTSVNLRVFFISHGLYMEDYLDELPVSAGQEGWKKARRGFHAHYHEATASGSGVVVPRGQEV